MTRHSEYNREWRHRNRTRYLENKRVWNAANLCSVRVSRRKSDQKYAKANRVKENCRRAVCRAIAKGVLVRSWRCSSCYVTAKTYAHHADYTKPLEVAWVCRLCHSDLDRQQLEEVKR